MDSKLDEIRQRTEAATPGPWEHDGTGSVYVSDEDDDGELCVCECDDICSENAEANGDFIAHSRDDVEWLLSEVARMIRRNNELECAYSAYDGSALERADKHIELQEQAIHDLKARAEAAEAEAADKERYTVELYNRAREAEARADAAIADLRKCSPCWLCKKKCGIFDALDQRKDGCCHNFEWRGLQESGTVKGEAE